MKVSFLNGRHIVKREYSIPERLWGDHKSYILKAHRTVLLLDCPFVAHLSFDNLSRRLSLTLRPRALLSVKPDKCSIRGLWTSCPCTWPREDSSSAHCLFTDCYLQRHRYRRWNTYLYFVTHCLRALLRFRYTAGQSSSVDENRHPRYQNSLTASNCVPWTMKTTSLARRAS